MVQQCTRIRLLLLPAIWTAQFLFPWTDARMLHLTDQDKFDIKVAWKVFHSDPGALSEIISAMVKLFEEKAGIQQFFPAIADVPLDQFQHDDRTRVVGQALLDLTDNFVSALEDEDVLEDALLRYVDAMHRQGVPIEELFLFPAGLVAEGVLKKLGSTVNRRVEMAITKCIFAVSALMCGPMSEDFLGLSEAERLEIVNTWNEFKADSSTMEGLLMAVFEMMPDVQNLVPGLQNVPVTELVNHDQFKQFVARLMTNISKFLESLHDADTARAFVRGVAQILRRGKLPLMGTFFGSSVLIIGAIQEKLDNRLKPEVKRSLLKMTYSAYPLLAEIETSELM